ncbi:hypothetical protein GCM10017687_20990 [Streptomyces echinatus]
MRTSTASTRQPAPREPSSSPRPIDRRAELRCYMRDPDGYLIEVGQSTGLLKGILARTDTEA